MLHTCMASRSAPHRAENNSLAPCKQVSQNFFYVDLFNCRRAVQSRLNRINFGNVLSGSSSVSDVNLKPGAQKCYEPTKTRILNNGRKLRYKCKVKTLTLHYAINYGCTLQTYKFCVLASRGNHIAAASPYTLTKYDSVSPCTCPTS